MEINTSLDSAYALNKHTGQMEEASGDKGLSKTSALDLAKHQPGITEVKQAVEDIQAFIDSVERNLKFSIDEGSGRVVVKVIAKASGELIRQMPTEEALELARSLKKRDDYSALLQVKV
ncbi:flagellar protein FlaG [Pseudomonas sp.]|uniref:flagellar protein FlaG n=1 Tax=Pseudomonas sp. TaxID=306 RepID=UPI0028A5B7F5|nr:flagellar protein FlaG [Pseudomonas sp.]